MRKTILIIKLMLSLTITLFVSQCKTAGRHRPVPVVEAPKPEPKPMPKPEPKPQAEIKRILKPAEIGWSMESFMRNPFPTPIPKPSAEARLTERFYKVTPKLKDVNRILMSALDSNKYSRWSYYYIEGGFVLVTQLERIKSNGISYAESDRWNDQSTSGAGRPFSLKDYINALFHARPGYYRCIVFIVTSKNFTTSGTLPDSFTADIWLDKGFNYLPVEVLESDLTQQHTVSAMIYEFKKPENGTKVTLVIPSSVSGNKHLINSGIAKFLPK